eukprot:scaffold7010_cov111-Skeletonema_dohrnii-CCMP3373.AAC.4
MLVTNFLSSLISSEDCVIVCVVMHDRHQGLANNHNDEINNREYLLYAINPTARMEAHFASYEDFSSSLMLLPFIDDSAIGAKVCSHNPPTPGNIDLEDVPLSDDEVVIPDDKQSKDTVEDESSDSILPEISEIVEEIVVAVERGETDTDSKEISKEDQSDEKAEPSTPKEADNTVKIPEDYVLTKMKTSDNESEIEELEHREFTELLTLLREASYPLSLVFLPPNEIVNVADSSREYGSDDEEIEDPQSSDDDAENDSAKANNPSVDEAAKYAKHAASELRGRLGRWGSVAAIRASAAAAAEVAATRASAAAEVAATRASQAASAVQELREGRSKEEEKKNQTDDNDASTSEWLPKVEPISDEETMDSSSKNSATLTCGGDNEDSESSNDQLTPSNSQDDNEEQIEQGSPGSCDNNDGSEKADVETSSLASLRLKQLETQLAEVHSRLEVKNKALNKLQQKLDASMNERKKIEKESRQTKKDLEAKNSKHDKTIATLTEEVQIITKALTECEAELEERNKKIDNMVAGNRDKALEHDKAIKALNNELSVCKAAIEARDSKVEALTESMTELKTKLAAQAEELSAVESLRNDLTQTKTQSSTAVQVIEKMKKEESEFQNELKEAKGIVDELSKKYTVAKAAATKSNTEAEKIKADYRRLKMERNSLKNKAESLQKEMNQIAKKSKNNQVDSAAFDKLQQELQQLRLEHTELQRDLDTERTEKRDLKAALNASRLAHQNPIINYQPTAESEGSPRTEELERIISEMTEYSSAQALQIETLRQINAALTEDITNTGSGDK